MKKEEAELLIEEVIDDYYEDDGYGNTTQHYDEVIEALRLGKEAIERYQDLVDYFSNKDAAELILGDRKEFKKWLDRMKWNVRKVDELAKKLEQELCEECVSKKAVDDLVWKYLRNGSNGSIAFYGHFLDLPLVTPVNGKLKQFDGVENTGQIDSKKEADEMEL